MKKRNIKLLVFALLVIAVVFFLTSRKDKEYKENSSFCAVDSDCQLYECTSCGNSIWIDKNKSEEKECTNKIPGLVGCKCEENICKRNYVK